jgi:hypothetical protein
MKSRENGQFIEFVRKIWENSEEGEEEWKTENNFWILFQEKRKLSKNMKKSQKHEK